MKILVTGASSGIGEALAKLYATQDNKLYLLARREDRLQKLQTKLAPLAKKVEIIVCDVTDFDTLQRKMRELPDVDMVILNAGISLGHSLEITPFEEFKRLYDVNIISNHAILEILLPKFLEKKSGKIVFISSLASIFSMPSSKVYSSSKRALNAYAEGLRYKYEPHGIKVLNILPGFVKSELTDKNKFYMPFLLSTEDGAKIIKRAIDKERRFYAFPRRFYYLILLFKYLPLFLKQKIIKHLFR
ncbi:SDR family NAD(P)-dependent oxidoreductase [Sulfurimonas crateris]|uniref:SDR family NAD(P)-dependent oxidoreductase n=1 Tax=Sulfurimonas crateris TaxID=2574727 RepID=A0A4U2Z3H9_9BACT|nr:SDR family NAD(P)-dependent oxidoreductase [Sulfurimonas crateris]TKI68717.1 SDR family NAD(P)-dependent oxidoreductase [Sulfurimonas crateris]